MQTRAEYMALPYVDQETAKARHRAYYRQFVTPLITNHVVSRIGANRLRNSVNRDGCFNDIPLGEWDTLHSVIQHYAGFYVRKANGVGGYSLSDSVCIAKEAARLWLDSQKS